MIKLVSAAIVAASLFSAGSAMAEDKVAIDPSKSGPTDSMNKQVPTMTPAAGTATLAKPACTATGIEDVNASIKSSTDKAKQQMAMDHMVMAKKSMDAKDSVGCEMHLKEALNSIGTQTK